MNYYGSSKETLKVELVERLKKERDSIFVAVLNRWVFGAESWFQSKALGLLVTWGGLRGSCLALVGNMQARPE